MSIHLVKWGGDGHEANYKEFLISGTSDVANLPKKDTDPPAAVGSVAYTEDLEHTYMLSPENTWEDV